jgi:hypothetical protein
VIVLLFLPAVDLDNILAFLRFLIYKVFIGVKDDTHIAPLALQAK